jgi:hypothetical protein
VLILVDDFGIRELTPSQANNRLHDRSIAIAIANASSRSRAPPSIQA